MNHGRERRVPQAFRDVVRRALIVATLCAVIVALLQVDGGAALPSAPVENQAGAGEPARASESPSSLLPASATHPAGRLDDAPDGAVSVLIAVGGDGALVPGDNLPLTIEVVNKTDTDVPAGEVVVGMRRGTIDSRAEYNSWLGVADPQRLPDATIEIHRAAVEAVGAGTATTITTEVPASALGLADDATFGPRGLVVQYVVDGDATAQGRSTVVVDGVVDAEPTPLAVVVPIVPPTGSPALLDADALAALTGPRGSLTQLLDAVEGTGATLAIDPRLLVSVRSLGSDAPDSAVAWLERLIALENDSFELPYADADLTLQLQQGREKPLELIDGAFAYDDAPADGDGEPTHEPSASAAPTDGTPGDGTPGDTATTADAPPAPSATVTDPSATADAEAEAAADASTAETPTPSPTDPDGNGDQGGEEPRLDLEELTEFPYTFDGVAWPTEGTLSAADLQGLAAWDYGTVLVNEASVERLDDYDFTPHAGLDLDGSTAIAADAQLNEALRLAANATSDADRDAAITQLSTVLAIVARELPYEQRPMFAITEHVAAANPAALGEVLDALAALPWVADGSLDEIAGEPEKHRATLVPGAHDQGTLDRFLELLVAETRAREFASMFDDKERFVSEERADLLATISAARLADPASWLASSAGYLAHVAEVEGGVVVTETSDIQLVGRETQLPVFVRNDTDHTVTVQVVLMPTTGRLEAGGPVTLRLTPGAMERAQLPVQAISNGHAVVDVQLLTPDGVLLPSTQSLQVNVQAEWETVTIIAAVVGLSTLFVWGLVRTIRRRTGRIRTADTSPPASAEVRAHDEEE